MIPRPESDGHRLSTVAGAQLFPDVFDVNFDGLFGEFLDKSSLSEPSSSAGGILVIRLVMQTR